MRILLLPVANARRDRDAGAGLEANGEAVCRALTLQVAVATPPDAVMLTEFGRISAATFAQLVDHMTKLGYPHRTLYRKDVPLDEQTDDFSAAYEDKFAVAVFTRKPMETERIELSLEHVPARNCTYRNGAVVYRGSPDVAHVFVHMSLAFAPGPHMDRVLEELRVIRALAPTTYVVGDLNLTEGVVAALPDDLRTWIVGYQQPDFVCTDIDWIPKRPGLLESATTHVMAERSDPEPAVRILSCLCKCSANCAVQGMYWPLRRDTNLWGTSFAETAAFLRDPSVVNDDGRHAFDHFAVEVVTAV